MTAKLLAIILLAIVKETLGSSSKYISAPVPVEKLLALSVASKNYSGITPPCPSPFDWLADVGCVFVVETEVKYAVAQTSCPGGSQLVSLYADNFFKLANYVELKSFIPSGKADALYYLGVHRYNRVWTWRTGQVMSGLPGTEVWGPGEPNDGSDCGGIAIKTGSGPRMVDLRCSIPTWYVCALQ
ncbi:uncharacterized protein LOC108672674 [Hyalella azteca]|uniref:Uncharacterized protein LOC108672674 n=1 Tax=Hyalella azteca TaxID=294128 RepID=A0A8B7NQB1_HYAAZ|nr:uncharacterized protein LOC108672674 [Hyalella azteca]